MASTRKARVPMVEQLRFFNGCRQNGSGSDPACQDTSSDPRNLMLGDISGLEKIYIVCGDTDMRKSIDGLCAMVEDQLKMNHPSASALFLFCGRIRDRSKALFHEPDGFVLIYTRWFKWQRPMILIYTDT